jgi:hypothetical protein
MVTANLVGWMPETPYSEAVFGPKVARSGRLESCDR